MTNEPYIFGTPRVKQNLRILDEWLPMVLYVMLVHDNCLVFSIADIFCTVVDAW